MTETELDAANTITEPRRIWTTVVAVCRHESVLLVILLVAVLVVGGLFEPAVFQAGNLANVSRNAAIIGIGGVGMTFVLLAGELDLSIGSIMSLSLVIGGSSSTTVRWWHSWRRRSAGWCSARSTGSPSATGGSTR